MRQADEQIPSLLLLGAGATSLLVAALGFLVFALVLLSTMIGARFFPERWLVATSCGLLPAVIATPTFLWGLREHDRGNVRASLRAFSVALGCIPLLLMGGAYVADWLPQ